jgi:hypothetical protein
LSLLNDRNVKYLLVGGYALMHYTEPRYTKDFDLWIERTPENAAKVFEALLQFGAPLKGIAPSDFSTPGMVYQMGRPPVRVDVMTSVDALEFSECWDRRVAGHFGKRDVWVISMGDLIVNKRATGRLQDLADAERLEEARNQLGD